MLLSGADIIVKTLIEQNCDVVFGYPGGQILHVYDSLYKYKDKIRHVLSAHEQGAAHAADGYARATGRPGVVIATSGPGATNLVTGIATAHLDSVPMVAITGNVSTAQIGNDSFQEIDITGITLPITKHNYFVGSVDELQETLREAFRLAMSGRPGPVLVDVPKDVQMAVCEYTPQAAVLPEEPSAAKDIRIEEAASCINSCEKPYIYFGGGLVSGEAQEMTVNTEKLIDIEHEIEIIATGDGETKSAKSVFRVAPIVLSDGGTVQELQDAGVEVLSFNPVHQYVNRLKFNYWLPIYLTNLGTRNSKENGRIYGPA